MDLYSQSRKRDARELTRLPTSTSLRTHWRMVPMLPRVVRDGQLRWHKQCCQLKMMLRASQSDGQEARYFSFYCVFYWLRGRGGLGSHGEMTVVKKQSSTPVKTQR